MSCRSGQGNRMYSSSCEKQMVSTHGAWVLRRALRNEMAYKIDLDKNGTVVMRRFTPLARASTTTPKPAKTGWRKYLQRLKKQHPSGCGKQIRSIRMSQPTMSVISYFVSACRIRLTFKNTGFQAGIYISYHSQAFKDMNSHSPAPDDFLIVQLYFPQSFSYSIVPVAILSLQRLIVVS